MAQWLARWPVKPEAAGSNPVAPVFGLNNVVCFLKKQIRV
jgi:hypothetical protein